MSILNKVKDNNKGIDITLYGTAIVLIIFISFCSLLDYWVLTFAKEEVLRRVEIYEYNSLAKNVNYTLGAYEQDFEGTFAAEAVKDRVEDDFFSTFNNGIKKAKGLIYDVSLASGRGGVQCYPSSSKNKIILESGPISFKVKKFLKAGNKVPFAGGSTKSYNNEIVFSSISTNIIFLFEK